MSLEKAYNMENYTILDNDHVPVIFKNKPRWMCCAIVVTGLLLLMLFSIAVGVVIAYIHCYIDHRTGKHTQELNLQITRTALRQPNNTTSTIDTTLTSKLFISRIVDLGRAIIEDGHNFLNTYKSKNLNKTEDLKVFL